MKECADGGFSAVNDLRNRLQKTMKDLELKIEKAQSLKDSLKDQHQALDEEIKAKSMIITEKTMKGEFDTMLMNEVKDLSQKIKDITAKDSG